LPTAPPPARAREFGICASILSRDWTARLTRANDVNEEDVVISTIAWGWSSMIAGNKPDTVPRDDRHRLRFCFSAGTFEGFEWGLYESNRHYLTARLVLANNIDIWDSKDWEKVSFWPKRSIVVATMTQTNLSKKKKKIMIFMTFVAMANGRMCRRKPSAKLSTVLVNWMRH
jgi:hypothetical protein